MRVKVLKRKICNQLIQQVNDFPPLPAIVSQILQITADPDSSIDDLKVFVEVEVALSASILKLANSPFFGLSREVSSIPPALAVLGLEEVKNLVLAKAMFNTFKGFRQKGDRVNGLWKHSFYCGLAATVIAKRLGYHSSDFFVAGLIHDIGKMVIYLALNKDNLGKLYDEVTFLDEMTVEQERLGVDHQHLGAELVRSWLFPESLQCGVGFHHTPGDATVNKEIPLILSLADMLVHLLDAKRDSEAASVIKATWMDKPDCKLFLAYGLDLQSESFDHVLHDVEKTLQEADDIAGLLGG
jgi:putative nucleotidyltransferase with HDIG domain